MHDDEKLNDVHPDESFRLDTGKEVKNLKQLLHVLEEISPDSFAHHVNKEKNDFASWIRHSVKDDELADMMEKTTDFNKTKQVINDRIALLEKKAEVREIKESLQDLKGESMGIDNVPSPIPREGKDSETPKDTLAPAEPPQGFVSDAPKPDEHPFEHLKRGIHKRVIDILIGVLVGLSLGFVIWGLA